MEFVNELLKRFFTFGRAPQLQKHMLHGKVTGDWPTIVSRASFPACVAAKSYVMSLVNDLWGQHTRAPV